MLSKKILILFLVASFPWASYSEDSASWLKFECFKDMGDAYPDFISGELEWSGDVRVGQKRFFRCLHDALELFVKHRIFVHDPSRDYFTKEEIFRMFHLYFDYDKETSKEITDKVFIVKKLLIGGSIDQLKDQEIEAFYKLVNDYAEIYRVIAPHSSVFKKLFSGGLVSPEEQEEALDKLRVALFYLAKAYNRENITYRLDDLDQYDRYLRDSGWISSDSTRFMKLGLGVLQNLLQGVLFPETRIKEGDWDKVSYSLYQSVRLFFHYKVHIEDQKLSSAALIYRLLEGAEIVLSALQVQSPDGEWELNKKGFPLKNLDSVLISLVSFLDSGKSQNSWLSSLSPSTIPLFTRIWNCFSLDSEEDCRTDEERESLGLRISFTDLQFDFLKEGMELSSTGGPPVFLKDQSLEKLKLWIEDYQKGILDIYNDRIQAFQKQNSHFLNPWMGPFFGWDENQRLVFGAMSNFDESQKLYQLLHYQSFLKLFTPHYLKKDFFLEKRSAGEDESSGISLKAWNRMRDDLFPIFRALGVEEESQSSWKKSISRLFQFADTFLYSSNKNDFLGAKELFDMILHLFESLKNVRIVDKKMSDWDCRSPQCVARNIIQEEEILSAYPRFQGFIFKSQESDYTQRIQSFLGEEESSFSAFDLLPLFMLIQIMEVNYYKMDTDQSLNLDSGELLVFAKEFESLLADQIPHLLDTNQARSYLMYSLKEGKLPFFTKNPETALEFSNWHLSGKNSSSFEIHRSDFHFFVFDLYKLYQAF